MRTIAADRHRDTALRDRGPVGITRTCVTIPLQCIGHTLTTRLAPPLPQKFPLRGKPSPVPSHALNTLAVENLEERPNPAAPSAMVYKYFCEGFVELRGCRSPVE